MPILDIWEKTSETVVAMSIQKIVSMAGDGSLKDGSETSAENRGFLYEIDSLLLRTTIKTFCSGC